MLEKLSKQKTTTNNNNQPAKQEQPPSTRMEHLRRPHRPSDLRSDSVKKIKQYVRKIIKTENNNNQPAKHWRPTHQ